MRAKVFCSGSFDLFHVGHILFFESIIELISKKHENKPYLVVGIGSDAEIKSRKGPDRPIYNQDARWKIVSSLKMVNHAFIVDTPKKTDRPYENLRKIFSLLAPSYYVVNSDIGNDDLAIRQEMMADFPKINFIVLDRTCDKKFGTQNSTTNTLSRLYSNQR